MSCAIFRCNTNIRHHRGANSYLMVPLESNFREKKSNKCDDFGTFAKLTKTFVLCSESNCKETMQYTVFRKKRYIIHITRILIV